MIDIGIIALGVVLVLIVAALCNVAGNGTRYEEGENLNVQGKSPRGHL